MRGINTRRRSENGGLSMNTEIQIDLWRCFKSLIKMWWIIAITGILCFMVSYVATYTTGKNMYYGETTVYSVAYGSYQQAIEGASAMRTYADIITSLKVSERAAKLLEDDNVGGKKIQKMVEVNYSEDSSVMSIYAYSTDHDLALKVANAVADAFVVEVRNITGGDNVQVLDIADTYNISNDASNSKIKIRVLAFAFGILASSMVICLLEALSTKVRSVADCSLNGELDIIGVIPTYEKV